MGKSLTIPLGYTVDNSNNIGTLTQVSGYNYDATNIKVSDIANLLDVSIYGIKDLSTSSKIKKWAAFKPTRLNSPHGIALRSSDLTLQYYPPDATSGYVLGQFAGYNHNPKEPYYVGGSDIYFTTDGSKLAMLMYNLPEVDLRYVYEGSITHIAVIIYDGAGYSNYVSTTVYEITDDNVQNHGIVLDYYYYCSGTSNINYRIHLDLGYINSMEEFVKYCQAPYSNKIVDDRLYIYKTAYYNVKTFNFPIWVNPTYVSGTDRILIPEKQNVSLNSTTGDYSFDYRIFFLPMEGDEDLWANGTCDIYAKDSSGTWRMIEWNSDLPGGTNAWRTVTGTLSNTYWPKPILNNVDLEFRNVVVTNSP